MMFMECNDDDILGLTREENKLVAELEFKFSKYSFIPKSFQLTEKSHAPKKNIIITKESKNGRKTKGTSSLF